MDIRRIINRLAEPDRNAAWSQAGPFPKELAAAEAENAAIDFVEPHRDNRRARAALDLKHAGLKALQLAGAADSAFGKDAHEVASLNRFARHFDRAPGRFGRRLDRDSAHESGEAM